MFTRSLILVALFCCITLHASAQSLALDTTRWSGREFRYWVGDPMMHGPNGECIAGYTDEERRVSFFADGRYQEIIFEDRGFATLRIWQPGDCEPLKGDTVALLNGTWSWAHDTMHVNVERTAQYPQAVVDEQYWQRRWTEPLAMTTPPSRICNTRRERSFFFEGERLCEAERCWD
ncbi:MAG TPA: hypothetical protein PK760_10215 [Flavobacteriales bacterium]|nr:hypothetical protein [Flavobacteriales bacterium]